MSQKLKTVEALPDQQTSEQLLGFSPDDRLDEGEAEEKAVAKLTLAAH